MRHILNILLVAAAVVFLSGCESSSERAEKHYEAGVAYYEDGDVTRAMVEMRNVLQLDPAHQAARRLFADMLRQSGETGQAFAHYRDLTERYPDDADAYLAAAEIALEAGDWASVERFGTRGIELKPDSAAAQVIRTNLLYREARKDEDITTAATAVETAATLVAGDPSLQSARRIVIDDLLRKQDWPQALETVDAGLEDNPDSLELAQIRLNILQQLGRTDDITAQLEDMVSRHPENEEIANIMVRWYSSIGNTDAAEAFLRRQAEAAPAEIERWKGLLSFLAQVRGPEALGQELDRLVAAGGDNTITFRAMRAALDFEQGERDQAIGALEALLADLPEEERSSAIANDVRADLARMYVMTGNNVRARELVDTVLQGDPNHIASLKILAAWQIEDDQVAEAIVTLRSALRESPRDSNLMTMMAAAHERAGEADLQREMLALAVETSGNAPEESLRYAAVLAGDGRYRPAEDVLVQALRQAPQDIRLLGALGNIYIGTGDWARAEQVISTLENLGAPGQASATEFRARMLAAQQKGDDLISYLEGLSSDGGDLGATIAVIRQYAAQGDTEKAEARLQAALAQNPGNAMLRFVDAALKASTGKPDEAAADFEALLQEAPQARQVWLAYYRLKLLQEQPDEASTILDRALEQLPEDADLLVARAGELERKGDVDGAIAVYEDIYTRNSSLELVANNLASLLSTYRSDEATLERAYQIGRRLQDSQVPAFRETYGWLAARLGRYEEAAEHLAVAAEAYPEMAVVQYHYAVALAGAGRDAEALEVFRKAQGLDPSSLPPEAPETIAAEITRLEGSPN